MTLSKHLNSFYAFAIYISTNLFTAYAFSRHSALTQKLITTIRDIQYTWVSTYLTVKIIKY